ncbi:MAG TPA: aminotransferase class I/II-fold pyridoxal phosphate-dependent enzyme [Thermoleophilia bacterium]|nr:aminotransferase class I/II-fold pyridoxal phosphate-dependent enzyme [Thermoleophilia bacterium]
MKLANRVARLGTETAFAVSAEAAARAAEGNKVYPFHLGDINLPTPQNVQEAAVRAMKDGKTGYCPNAGIPQLREVLAAEISHTHGIRLGPHNVAVQPGGKPVIGKFLLSLVNPGDEVLYPNPGFPIYESQIEFHGATAVPYAFVPGEDNFLLDIEAIESAITPKTRAIIFNDLHNPTGAVSPRSEIEAVADLARKHDLYVLSDEAYWDVRYGGEALSIASLPGMAERTVILYTFSKKFAMTGWRLGAAVGPEDLIDVIATLNVNEESCTNHFVQWAGVEALTGDQSEATQILETLLERRDVAVKALNRIPGVSCYTPTATFYLFPDVTGAMDAVGAADHNEFRVGALEETGCSFCTRLHFGRALPGEERSYIRIAYSGIDSEQIEEGLGRLMTWVEGA